MTCFSPCGTGKLLDFKTSPHLSPTLLDSIETNGKASIDSRWDSTQLDTSLLPLSSFPWSPSLPGALAPVTTQEVCPAHSADKRINIAKRCRLEAKELPQFFSPGNSLNLFYFNGCGESFLFLKWFGGESVYNITEGCLGTQPADLPKDYLKNTLNNFTEERISFIILSNAVKPLCSVWRDNFLLSARSLLIKEKKSAAQLFYWLRFILQTQRSTT